MSSSGTGRRESMASTSHAEPVFRQLCHMLSLSRTGKIQSAVDSLVLTTMSLDPRIGDGGDLGEVAQAVSTYFGVSLDVEDVRVAIEAHLAAGRLLIDQTREPVRMALAPASAAELATRVADASRLEDDVRLEWLTLAQDRAPEVKPADLWTALQNYLGQVFKQHGAEAVQLLDSRSGVGDDKGNLLGLMDRAIDSAGLRSSREPVREAIRSFFIAPTPNRLRYISELLDGTFTFFALTVSDSTAEYLKAQIPTLRLFLDTNVVLAVLGMQDNPLEAADLELLDVIKHEAYPFKLCVHERTFKEILDILDAVRTRLQRTRFTPALSRAYIQIANSRGINGFGLEKRFHTLNAERQVDVEAFLARFNHIEELLKDRGIQRYNQAGADLNTESKGAHIAEFEHFLKGRRRGDRPSRRYEALDHDITVWMFLQRQRQETTSAIKSGALLLSNDYSLHAFDRSYLMNTAEGKHAPTVVLPHHLLQILRPLRKVTENFDERFLAIFAAPEFRTTQSDYGPTMSKVLKYLSSFDGVATETAVNILNDDLLMGRLKDVEDADLEFGEAIENAVLKENGELARSLSEMSDTLSAKGRDVDSALSRAEEDRAAREDAERQAKATALTAAESVELAKAELVETRKREQAESEARRVAEAEAEAAAVAKVKLETELTAERQRRISAENTVSRAKSNARILRWVLALMFALLASVLLVWGPEWVDWTAFKTNPNRTRIQWLGILIFAGLAYIGGGGKHRNFVGSGVVIAAVISIISLI